MLNDENYMLQAVQIAKGSGVDLPVGAIIVNNGNIIAKAHNEKELKNNSTLHAEMVVIQEAQAKLNKWRLDDCELYVTLEPCPMCAWAIIQSRISKVVFGAHDALYGALGTKIDLRQLANSNLKVVAGIKEEECQKLLNDYIKQMRKKDEVAK